VALKIVIRYSEGLDRIMDAPPWVGEARKITTYRPYFSVTGEADSIVECEFRGKMYKEVPVFEEILKEVA
jgi:hypothetical protein